MKTPAGSFKVGKQRKLFGGKAAVPDQRYASKLTTSPALPLIL